MGTFQLLSVANSAAVNIFAMEHSFDEYLYAVLFDMDLGVELLDHRIHICSALVNTAKQIFKAKCTNGHSHRQRLRVLVTLHSCQY